MYITVDELRAYANIHDENDSLMQIFIDSAENSVEGYLGYTLTRKAYVSYIDGNADRIISLEAQPVELTKVSIDGVEVDLVNFIVKKNSLISIAKDVTFPVGWKNIKCEYSGGFEEIPGLIKSTILRIAALLATESDGNIGVTSKSFADTGSRTFNNFTEREKYLRDLSDYRIL